MRPKETRIAVHQVDQDQDWPRVNEPLGGGPEFHDGDILQKYASVHAVKGYQFQLPSRNYFEYVRLVGNLYDEHLRGARAAL